MSEIEVSLQLPEELVEKASTAAQFTDRSKDEIVAEALRDHLSDVEAEDTIKRELFDQYLEGEIGIDTVNHFLDKEGKELEHFSKMLSTRQKEYIKRSMEK